MKPTKAPPKSQKMAPPMKRSAPLNAHKAMAMGKTPQGLKGGGKVKC